MARVLTADLFAAAPHPPEPTVTANARRAIRQVGKVDLLPRVIVESYTAQRLARRQFDEIPAGNTRVAEVHCSPLKVGVRKVGRLLDTR